MARGKFLPENSKGQEAAALVRNPAEQHKLHINGEKGEKILEQTFFARITYYSLENAVMSS